MSDTLPKFTLERAHTPFSALDFEAAEELPLGRHTTLDVSQRAPLLNAEAVALQIGAHVGDLMAVVQLPVRHALVTGSATEADSQSDDWRTRFRRSLGHTGEEMDSRIGAAKIYCFRTASKGRHGAESQQYYLMGGSQIEQLRAGTYGAGEESDVSGGVLGLARGEQVVIGRDGWLPSIGWDYQLLKGEDPWVSVAFQSVSRQQASAIVDAHGRLLLAGSSNSSENNGNDMRVSLGEPSESLAAHPRTHLLGQAGLKAIA
jgi:hypothetical protein